MPTPLNHPREAPSLPLEFEGRRDMWGFLPMGWRRVSTVDTLVIPSCSHQCQGGQGAQGIPEVTLSCARAHPRP